MTENINVFIFELRYISWAPIYLGAEQMICVLVWGACPCDGGRCGSGSPPPTTGVRRQYHLENWDILHKKWFIFVHICMMLVVIAILMHRNARQSGKILGDSPCCPPTKLLGTCPPSPDFGAYSLSSVLGALSDTDEKLIIASFHNTVCPNAHNRQKLCGISTSVSPAPF